jgi:hypothetical protein
MGYKTIFSVTVYVDNVVTIIHARVLKISDRIIYIDFKKNHMKLKKIMVKGKIR